MINKNILLYFLKNYFFKLKYNINNNGFIQVNKKS